MNAEIQRMTEPELYFTPGILLPLLPTSHFPSFSLCTQLAAAAAEIGNLAEGN